MAPNNLAWKIHHLRTSQGLTLEQVAQQVGVGKSTVRKWETGMIENMRRDKIASLAAALHTTPGYLMGWEDGEYKVNLSPTQQSEMLEIFSSAMSSKDITEGFAISQSGVSSQFFIRLQKPQSCLVSIDELQSLAKYLDVEEAVIRVINHSPADDNNGLTTRDQKDIAKSLEQMMSQLEDSSDLMFDGDPMSDEARESIRQALQMGLEIAKVKNKERFTPHKYRKG